MSPGSFLLLVLLFCDNQVGAQENLSKKKTQQVASVCATFLAERTKYLQHADAGVESLQVVAGDSMVTYIELLKLYHESAGITTATAPLVPEISVTDSGVFCHLLNEHTDSIFVRLQMQKEDRTWKVSHYPGVSFGVVYENLRKATLLYTNNTTEIETAVQLYFHGMDDLKSLGDTAALYKSTTPELYELLKLDYAIFLVKGQSYRKRQYDSLNLTALRFRSDTVATVHIIYGRKYSADRTVVKKDSGWRVAGRFQDEANAEDVEEKRVELAELKIGHDVRQQVFALETAINAVFIKNDYTLLANMATPPMVELAKKMRLKAGTFDPEMLIPREKSGTNQDFYFEGQIAISGDTVNYSNTGALVQFTLINGSWTMVGFHHYYSGVIKPAFVEDHFDDFLILADFYFDQLKGEGLLFDMNGLPDENDSLPTEVVMDEDFWIPVQQEPGLSRVRNCFEIVHRPVFTGNGNALYAFISANLRYPSYARQKRIQGSVYLDFIVEKDGRLSDIRIVSSPHSSLSNEAIRIVKLMPPWEPGTMWGNNSVRARHTIVIEFSL